MMKQSIESAKINMFMDLIFSSISHLFLTLIVKSFMWFKLLDMPISDRDEQLIKELIYRLKSY